jgi:hypothetical protein
MLFFKSLFKDKATRESETRLRLRQGKSRILQYLRRCRASADKYFGLCRQAYQLGDMEQFKQLAFHHLNAQRSVNRWERFLIKLEALEMRRDEVSATADFLRSMATVTSSILRDAAPVEIGRLQANIGRALDTARSQEEQMDLTMEACGNALMDGRGEEPLLVDAMTPVRDWESETGKDGVAKAQPNERKNASKDALDEEIARALRELDATLSNRTE